MANPIASFANFFSTLFDVAEKGVEVAGSASINILETVDQLADAGRRIAVTTNHSAQVYELEALGKTKAKAKELGLDIEFK